MKCFLSSSILWKGSLRICRHGSGTLSHSPSRYNRKTQRRILSGLPLQRPDWQSPKHQPWPREEGAGQRTSFPRYLDFTFDRLGGQNWKYFHFALRCLILTSSPAIIFSLYFALTGGARGARVGRGGQAAVQGHRCWRDSSQVFINIKKYSRNIHKYSKIFIGDGKTLARFSKRFPRFFIVLLIQKIYYHTSGSSMGTLRRNRAQFHR